MLKKETERNHKQIYSIRKNKAYGASSVLIGLMGSVFLLGGLAPAVQAEENDAKPEVKPTDASNSSKTNASTVETDHLIITSSQSPESAIKPESISTDAPKLNEENPSTRILYLNQKKKQLHRLIQQRQQNQLKRKQRNPNQVKRQRLLNEQ